jgi:hypothetical protein
LKDEAMSGDTLLPRRLLVLGEALSASEKELSTRVDVPVDEKIFVSDMLSRIQSALGALEATLCGLVACVNDMMDGIVSNEAADDAAVHRFVGRFDAFLEQMIIGYQNVQSWEVYGEDALVRDLLAGVYHHSLDETQEWLQETTEALTSPMTVLKRRGLPTEGHVELRLMLTLTEAPELEALLFWAECQISRRGVSAGETAGRGLLETLGLLAVGWGIGKMLFSGRD